MPREKLEIPLEKRNAVFTTHRLQIVKLRHVVANGDAHVAKHVNSNTLMFLGRRMNLGLTDFGLAVGVLVAATHAQSGGGFQGPPSNDFWDMIPDDNNDDDDETGETGNFGVENAGAFGGVDFQRARDLVLAHGALAAIAFVAVFPVGAVAMRLVRGRSAIFVHAGAQLIGLSLFIAAVGIGIFLVSTMRFGDRSLVSLTPLLLQLPPPWRPR